MSHATSQIAAEEQSNRPVHTRNVNWFARPLAHHALICGLILAVYAPGLWAEFINFDDPYYTSQQAEIAQGLTPHNLWWPLIGTREGVPTWHPITWWSLMLDAHLWGTWPGGFKLTNMLLHAVSCALLLAWSSRLFGSHWFGLAVTLIVGLHPFQVESVCWISERKGMLSSCFGHIAFYFWVRFLDERKGWQYHVTTAALVASLMSKQMLVTFPVLALLIFWLKGQTSVFTNSLFQRIREGVSLTWLWFVLGVALSAIAFLAQLQGAAVKSSEKMPLLLKSQNVLVCYTKYLRKFFWPSDLAVYYKFPEQFGVQEQLIAAVVLMGLLGAMCLCRRRLPEVTFGVAWYLISLLPVIGFIQLAGKQLADRYMYLPSVGVAVVIVTLGRELLLQKGLVLPVKIAAGIVVLLLAGTSFSYVLLWDNTLSLFHQVRRVDPQAAFIHRKLAGEYGLLNQWDLARDSIVRAIAALPNDASMRNDLVLIELNAQNYAAARDACAEAVRLDPGNADYLIDFWRLSCSTNQGEPALAVVEQQVHADAPRFAPLWCEIAQWQLDRGQIESSKPYLDKALQCDQDYPETWGQLARYLVDSSNNEAIKAIRALLATQPANREVTFQLARALRRAGQLAAAKKELVQLQARQPLSRRMADELRAVIAQLSAEQNSKPSAKTATGHPESQP